MIRLRPLRPREQRNLRHWAMELVVVVVGVLLALWVAEWAEDRRELREVAIAEQAVRDEIIYNLAGVEAWDSFEVCNAEGAERLIALARDTGTAWPGLDADSREAEDDTPIYRRNPFNFTLYKMRSGAWESAEANGHKALFDPEARALYDQFHFVARELNKRDELMSAALRGLRPYQYPSALDAAARRELTGHLLEIETNNTRIGDLAEYARELRSEETWSAQEREAFALEVANWGEIVGPRIASRECYSVPDPELAWKVSE